MSVDIQPIELPSLRAESLRDMTPSRWYEEKGGRGYLLRFANNLTHLLYISDDDRHGKIATDQVYTIHEDKVNWPVYVIADNFAIKITNERDGYE